MNTDEIILKLFRSLLNTSAAIIENAPSYLQIFEETHCYEPSIQPLFTKEALSLLMNSMKENTFYEIVDKLGIHAVFFKVHGHTYLIGPFVTLFFDTSNVQILLKNQGLALSHMTPLRLRYTNYPYMQSTDLYHTLLACLNTFYEDLPDFTYRTIYGFENAQMPNNISESESIDYSAIYKRYESENKLLDSISDGNVDHLVQIFDQMKSLSQDSFSMYTSSIAYHSPSAIMRALARKAAERGGLPVVLINELTQQQVQAEVSNRKNGVPDNSLQELIINLANAVAEHKKNTAGCSPAVVSVIDFIFLNYSQQIKKDEIAKVSGYSASHLSKIFKEETGSSISEYISKTRIEKAAELLKNSDLEIQEVGLLVGYPDPNYFIKRFKAYYKMTPGAYRNT